MDLAASAVGAVAGLLMPGKAKLVRADAPAAAGGGGGLGGALSAVAAALPIPGLGKDDKDHELTFMFNPTEYKITQSVHVERSKSVWAPGGKLEYLGTSAMTVTMQLFFDDFASIKGDVTPKISKLLAWQMPKVDVEPKLPPPLVKFEWGNKQLKNFTGVISSLTINYTVFAKDGTPLQAKVDVTLDGTDKLTPGKNPSSHSVDMRRVHTVVEGETLASVAYSELGRAGYWRAIAEVNGIDDPLRVHPGKALLIPSVADAARNG